MPARVAETGGVPEDGPAREQLTRLAVSPTTLTGTRGVPDNGLCL